MESKHTMCLFVMDDYRSDADFEGKDGMCILTTYDMCCWPDMRVLKYALYSGGIQRIAQST